MIDEKRTAEHPPMEVVRKLQAWEGCVNTPGLAPLILQAADLIESLQSQLADAIAEQETLQQWVNDLQSGMYVNCVYCGHRYGPSETTPVTMADVLKEHIENCPKHPMSTLKAQLAESQAREKAAVGEVCRRCPGGEVIDGLKHFPCSGCDWRGV